MNPTVAEGLTVVMHMIFISSFVFAVVMIRELFQDFLKGE